MTCQCSRSLPRRLVVAVTSTLVPRPPSGWRAALLLRVLIRIHSAADWVAWRAEDVIMNLEDPPW